MQYLTSAALIALLVASCSATTLQSRPSPPPGAEPVGYWAGRKMRVVTADIVMEPCVAQLVREAAGRVGKLAGVEVSYSTYEDYSATKLVVQSGEVLVVPAPELPPRVAAQTFPVQVSGGWIRAALVIYSKSATCSEHWLRVLEHEFGHAYGLQDTRDRRDALMHWQGSAGDILRPWELEHLRRRIVNQ